MASNSDLTVYPTESFDYQHATYTGHYGYGYGGGYGNYGGNSNALGSDNTNNSNNPMQRGASYFFGFLITFIVLLLMFVCCGITARRRYLSRQRSRRLQSSQPGISGFTPFGGLLGQLYSNQVSRQGMDVANFGVDKEPPTYHEVQLADLETGKPGGGAWSGKGSGNRVNAEVGPQLDTWFSQKGKHGRTASNWSWSSIEPLSATIVKLPKDLQPYEHFENLGPRGNDDIEQQEVDRTSYWVRNPGSGYVSSQQPADTDMSWYTRLRVVPAWKLFKNTRRPSNESSVAYPLPPVSRPGTAGSSGITLGDANVNDHSRSTSSSSTLAENEEPSKVKIAVMVAMPNGQSKAPPSSSREYQIGLTTADYVEGK